MAETVSTVDQDNFFKREACIRYAGVLLTLSPIGNFFWSAAWSGYRHWYRPHMLWVFVTHVPAVLWLLWGLTFLAGTLMLKGKRSSWNFTLFILGANIVFGMTTFKVDVHGGWLRPTLSLIINLSFFALVYAQEFHQRLERGILEARAVLRAAAANRPIGLAVKFELPVYFDAPGAGPRAGAPWATITEVTHAGIRLRSVDGEAPRQIEFRTVELALERGLALRARFSAKIGPDFVFRFTNMDVAKLALLHRWTRRLSTRGTVLPLAPASRAAA